MADAREVVFEFASDKDDREPIGPVELNLPGLTEPITCTDDLDGLATIDFTAAMIQTGATRVVGVMKFLKRVIDSEGEWARFEQWAKDNNAKPQDLAEIASMLVSSYTNVPTAAPTPSTGGRRKSSSKSKGVSSDAA